MSLYVAGSLTQPSYESVQPQSNQELVNKTNSNPEPYTDNTVVNGPHAVATPPNPMKGGSRNKTKTRHRSIGMTLARGVAGGQRRGSKRRSSRRRGSKRRASRRNSSKRRGSRRRDSRRRKTLRRMSGGVAEFPTSYSTAGVDIRGEPALAQPPPYTPNFS